MRRLFSPLLITLLLFSQSAIIAHGATEPAPEIKEFTATTTKSHLILFATLKNSLTKEMKEVLHSGLPLNFTFYVELYKIQGSWSDEQIIAYSFKHSMKFDTLKEMYQVTLEEGNNKTVSLKNLSDAEKRINDVNGVKVVSLDQLIPDSRYKLKIKAKLFQKTLPLGLQSIFPFLSWGTIETNWRNIEFIY